MVKVTFWDEQDCKVDIFPESFTVKMILEKMNVAAEGKRIYLDWVEIQEDNIDQSLRELGTEERVTLTLKDPGNSDKVSEASSWENLKFLQLIGPGQLPEMMESEEKIPFIYICGTAAVVKSGIRMENWQGILSENPEIGLRDENGLPLFKVCIEEGPGSMNENGVVFSEIPTKDGYACLTMILDPFEPDKERMIYKRVGLALQRLITLESMIRGRSESCSEDISHHILSL